MTGPRTVEDRTHWEGCWRDHHACAVAKIEAAPAPDYVMVTQMRCKIIEADFNKGTVLLEMIGEYEVSAKEYVLAAVPVAADDDTVIKCSASTERVARAIYERLVYAGEPLKDVLDDYMEPPK